jgi:hypothetical protein
VDLSDVAQPARGPDVRGVAFALVVSLTVSPALASSVGLANPAEFGLRPVPQASTAITCSGVAYERLCGTSEQWQAFTKDACHRFRDGFGGDAVQCFEANMAFSRSGPAALAPQESQPPPASNLPECNSYDAGLALRRLFRDKPARGTIMMISNERPLSLNDGVRTCSAELLLNRSWSKSPTAYVEWTEKAASNGAWVLTLTHFEDL